MLAGAGGQWTVVSEPASQAQAATAEEAQGRLFASLYAELHRIARRELHRNSGGVTLSATTLLHEAYLNLSARDAAQFPDRARFLAYASKVMRGLIVDFARNRRALKRGGAFELTALPLDAAIPAPECVELERLSEAVERLARIDPRLAQVVDLKYFSGFSFAEIAGMCEVSERTVQRDWEKARLFLHQALGAPEGGSMSPSAAGFRLNINDAASD
jgi:RNA polymerase sigma factor (TIGR02999 family)